MIETKFTISKMITQIITENQLSLDEELDIKKLLEERVEARKDRCLAGIIEKELDESMKTGQLNESTKQRYYPILRRCFMDTVYGNLDASSLSEAVIQEFVLEALETYNLNRNDLLFFTGMLMLGLNKMSQRGLISFDPDKKILKSYIDPVDEFRYIRNPYSEKETDLIMEWIEDHPTDTRALAIGLWLSGGLCPMQIINLKKEEYFGNSNMPDITISFDKNIFNVWQRFNYIRKAAKLHSEDTIYVFMVEKNGIWKKLTGRSLQVKLYHICQDIGIKYKSFHQNEVIYNE